MTGQEIITWTDTLSPNAYTFEQKLVWLSDLDGRVWRELVLTHEHPWDAVFTDYEDGREELLIPDPYARDVYSNYLLAKIAQANREIVQYNQYMTLFNTAYGEYSAEYNRTHKPLRRRKERRWRF